jgi:hypothetical protein
MSEHNFDQRDDARGGFIIPKSVMWAAMLMMLAWLATGIWYMATQAADARTLARDFIASQIETSKARTEDSVRIQTATTAQNLIENRMTRMEAALSFMANNPTPTPVVAPSRSR